MGPKSQPSYPGGWGGDTILISPLLSDHPKGRRRSKGDPIGVSPPTLRVLSVVSALYAFRKIPGLLPALAVAPVAKGRLLPSLLPSVPTIMGESFLITVVVDSSMTLIGVIGRISKPIAIQGAETTPTWIGWHIALGGGSGPSRC